jgi:hypothetical protein
MNMKKNPRKDMILNSAVLFAAWLVVIAACVGGDADLAKPVVRIAYEAQ